MSTYTSQAEIGDCMLAARAAYVRGADVEASIDRLVAELWRYSWPVLLDMLRTGDLVAQIRLPLRLSDTHMDALRVDRYLREDLAAEIFVETYEAFVEREIREPRWDPDGSAKLGTWFIGACTYCAHKVLRQWASAHDRRMREVDSRYYATAQRAFETADAAEALRIIVRTAPHNVRPLLSGIISGSSITEVARELGMPESTAYSRIARYRRNARRVLDAHSFAFGSASLIASESATPGGEGNGDH